MPRVGAALVTLVILRVTLSPGGAGAAPPPWCLVCGEHAASDAIRNILLFLPLGVLLRRGGVSFRRSLAAGAVLSLLIELSQSVIPGRDPSVADVMANTLGAAAGAWAAGLPRAWLVPAPGRALRLASAWCAAILGLWIVQRPLLVPALPASTWYGQWVPQLGHLAWYGGSVREARLGAMPLPDGPIQSSRDARSSLLAGDTLVVEAVAGPLTSALAPIFSIADERGREIVLAGAEGEDFVVRYRTNASRFRLEQPSVRLPGALRGIPGGTDLAIRVWNVGPHLCLRLNEHGRCSSPELTRGWTLVVTELWLDPGARTVAATLWIACLVLPACYWLALALRPAVPASPAAGSASGGTGT